MSIGRPTFHAVPYPVDDDGDRGLDKRRPSVLASQPRPRRKLLRAVILAIVVASLVAVVAWVLR
jgi:hypothetical protein